MQRFQITRVALVGWIALLTGVCTKHVRADELIGPVYSNPDQLIYSGTGGLSNGMIPVIVGIPGAQSSPSGSASRDGWVLRVGASATLTYTDNVFLAPTGQEQPDFSLATSVPISLRGEGSRVKFWGEYVPTYFSYARFREANDLQNNLRSLLTVEAVDNFFFVDASANIYQSYISPVAARPESGASITPNRTQQTTLGLSPYIRHDNKSGWSYLVRNDNFWNTYSVTGLGSSLTNSLTANAESPPAELRYAFDYSYLHTRYEAAPVSYYEQLGRVRPILTVTPRLKVSARLGYETNDYAATSYSGAVYGAGLDWTPNPLTKLEGFIEHRFFGASYGLTLNHRTRLTAWNLSATRNSYTAIDQPLTLQPGSTADILDSAMRSRIPDPTQRRQAVQQFLANSGLPPTLTQQYSFYSNQTYVAEQVSASVGLLGRINTLMLTLFWQQNEPITASGSTLPGIFATFNQYRQKGATLTYSHRVTELSTLSFTANRVYGLATDPTVAIATNQLETIQDTLRLSLTRQLSPKTDGSIGVGWSNFDSTVNPYQALTVFGTISHGF